MNARQWLDERYTELGGKSVKLVLFPAPPTPVGDIIFMPDSFASKIFDAKLSHNGLRLISMMPTTLGPAILATLDLSTLLEVRSGVILVRKATCCPSVTFSVLLDADGLRYANRTDIHSITLISRSCHPGSHFVVPSAPYLTALLHYALAPDWDPEKNVLIGARGAKIQGFVYMSPKEARNLFSSVDFSENILVDRFVSRCVIDPKVTYCRTHGGLGKWSIPYIKRMRSNLLEVDQYEGELWSSRRYELFAEEKGVAHGR